MPESPPDDIEGQIGWLQAQITSSEMWLALHMEELEAEGTAHAGIKIAMKNSRIYNFKRSLYSLRASLEETPAAARLLEQLGMEADRHAREWEQQRARMVNLEKADLLPKAMAVLERWEQQGDVLNGIAEDPNAPIIPGGT